MAKFNLIGKDGSLVLQNCLEASELELIGEGYMALYYDKDHKCVILNNNMQRFLTKQRLEKVFHFRGGVAAVRRIVNDVYEWNFINRKGQLISGEWFDSAFYIGNDIPAVLDKNSYPERTRFVDKKTGRLSDDGWFEEKVDFGEHKVALVIRCEDKACNFINKDGEYLFDEWFIGCDYGFPSTFVNGYVAIERASDGKWNFIDEDLNYLSDEWFAKAYIFGGEYAVVQRSSDEKWNFIDKNGGYLCKEWYNDVGGRTTEELHSVQREDGKWNLVDNNGNIISEEQWFDEVEDIVRDCGRVVIGGEEFVIDKNGILTPE